jgi:cytochrome c-type biogenesis protein CcmH
MTKPSTRFLISLVPVLIAMLLSFDAFAVQPDEMLANPGQESRALALSKNLRCVVCQNQNIDDSAAPIARDMRLKLRERIAAGDTDNQAVSYLVQRYGNYVLLKPPFQADTWLLWLTPFGVLAVAAGGLVVSLRRRAAIRAPEPLSAAEQKQLAPLLGTERTRT